MNMKYVIYGVIALAAIGYFALSNDSSAQKINLTQVLSRSSQAFENYDKYLKKNNVDKATEKHLEELNKYLQQAMNLDPQLHTGPIAMRLGKDAKFTGVDDANGNGAAEDSETKLFTLEIDSQNKRLIATDSSGTGTSRGFSGMGFIAGALMGAMLGRQRSAGVTPSSFSNRKLTSPAAYGQARSQARSRARSGGLRGGK